MERLLRLLPRLQGRSYKGYKDLEGRYRFPRFDLEIDHVQGDPFAAPSRLTVFVPPEVSGIPSEYGSTPVRRTALEDFLGRSVARAMNALEKRGGSGRSGDWRIATSGEEVLLRNAVLIGPSGVEARITAGLPAAGRRILADEAAEMLLRQLPQLVEESLVYRRLPGDALRRHVESAEDQEALRRWLPCAGLVAFVADGARLPRRSGIDDRPLLQEVVPFHAPDSLARTVRLPHGGEVRGMGIPAGVTLIVGGGFHGKSTLLHALERGVYDHIPGDGRERVVTDPTAVKIRAEDGRLIRETNISPFIRNLPFGRDTFRFTTENASGSTSQAANIMEALECGARTLLIDEDTSATNFMIRDVRMRALVREEQEPITPLLFRVRELYDQFGISTVIVTGGCGDYLSVADTVIMMDGYRPKDVSASARSLAGPPPTAAPGPDLDKYPRRRNVADLFIADRKTGPLKIESRGTATLLYGRREIDLSRVEQVVDPGQILAIGFLLNRNARSLAPEEDPIRSLASLLSRITKEGLDLLPPWKRGDLALPRLYEAAAALHRLRP